MFRNWFSKVSPRPRSSARLGLETMEGRDVPSAVTEMKPMESVAPADPTAGGFVIYGHDTTTESGRGGEAVPGEVLGWDWEVLRAD